MGVDFVSLMLIEIVYDVLGLWFNFSLGSSVLEHMAVSFFRLFTLYTGPHSASGIAFRVPDFLGS